MDNVRYWLWLAKIFGTANNNLWHIISKFDDVKEVYYAVKAGQMTNLLPNEIKKIKEIDISYCDNIIEYCKKNNYNIITYDDNNYPDRLKGIYNPTPVLFCMGNPKFVDDEVALTVVGTRKPSEYSIKVANKLCEDLASVGTVLVSGFAVGIDSRAHAAALKKKTPTIAVLGCGLDIDYPKGNTKFKKIIADNGGAVITEFFPGTTPSGTNFPQRNRLMAGLGLGTVVIEAGKYSGSLITAELALQNGKDVFCIPPSDIFDPRYNGCASLIRDGAIPVFSYYDIISEYYSTYTHKIDISERYYSLLSIDVDDKENKKSQSYKADPKTDKKTGKQETKNNTTIQNIDYSELNEIQTSIVNLLRPGKKTVNDISEALSLDISDTMINLTELEIMGYVRPLPGSNYSL